jgi:hypothetical protein
MMLSFQMMAARLGHMSPSQMPSATIPKSRTSASNHKAQWRHRQALRSTSGIGSIEGSFAEGLVMIANFVDVNMVSGAPSYLSFIHFEAQVKLSPNFREI